MNEEKLSLMFEKSGTDIYSFFRFFCSYYVVDIQKAFSFLHSELDDSEKIKIISECLIIKGKMEKERKHEKKDKDSIDRVYEYCKNSESLRKINKTEIKKIYESICKICFDGSDLNYNDKAKKAIDYLHSISAESEKCLELLYDLHLSMSSKRSAENFANSPDELNMYEGIFSKILTSLKGNTEYWKDAVCAAYYDSSYNDIELENRFVYYAFSRHFDINNKDNFQVSIIDPSPFFIKKWMKDSALSGIKTDFVFTNEFLQMFEKYFYSSETGFSFLTYDDFDKRIQGGSPSYTLYFGNHTDNSTKKAELIDRIFNEARGSNYFFILGNDFELTSPKSNVHQILTKMNIKRIDLLPGALSNSTSPKRKMFISAEYGYVNIETNEKSTYVVFYSLEKEGNYQSIIPKMYNKKISHEEFSNECENIRSKYYKDNTELLTKDPDKKRYSAQRYFFSNEIEFHFSTFLLGKDHSEKRIKVSAYISNLGKQYDGRIQNSDCEKRNIKEENIEKWLESEYPYRTKYRKDGEKISIKELISNAFKRILFDSRNDITYSLSLKSFIFIFENEISTNEKEIEILRYLGRSKLGYYDIKRITSGLLSSFLDENVDEIPVSVNKIISLLCTIFDFAMDKKLCNFNPAKEIERKDRERFDELDEIRAAVSKRFFTITEMRQILKKCVAMSKKGDICSVAVLIRIFTGLDTSTISALKWKDLKSFRTRNGKEVLQFRIEKRIGNNNKYVYFDKSQQVRLIPLCDELSKHILILKEREMKKYVEITEDQFAEKAIISGNDQTINIITQITSPKKINDYSKKLVKNLKINSDIISIPDNKYDVLDNDLNTYSGDIFRNSFRHYLLRNEEISSGELCYLLGNLAEDVDYDHYIDCASDREQELLYLMIQCYESLLMEVKTNG